VARREALVKGADVFIAGPDLTAVLDTLLGAGGQYGDRDVSVAHSKREK
jgi:hypothetical protein